jgi:hypothetical protein
MARKTSIVLAYPAAMAAAASDTAEAAPLPPPTE